jgi:hypothetical protein
VLVRGAGVSKPGIVGDISKKMCPLLHKPSGEIRKDDFIADENTTGSLWQVEEGDCFAGVKIPYPLHHFIDKGEEPFKRNIFAIGNKMNFIIPSYYFTMRREQEGTVEIVPSAISLIIHWASQQEIGAGLTDDGKDQMLVVWLRL